VNCDYEISGGEFLIKLTIRAARGFMLMSAMIFVSSAIAADDYTVELYDTYCKACHSISGTGAPVSFLAEEWRERATKGLNTLVDNAVNGIGNMPAQGLCQECSYDDFEDLINYMSRPK